MEEGWHGRDKREGERGRERRDGKEGTEGSDRREIRVGVWQNKKRAHSPYSVFTDLVEGVQGVCSVTWGEPDVGQCRGLAQVERMQMEL